MLKISIEKMNGTELLLSFVLAKIFNLKFGHQQAKA